MGPDASGKLGADGSAAAATPAASASAASASGYPDLPGRIGDPGDGHLPAAASAATAASASAGARARLIELSLKGEGLAVRGGALFYRPDSVAVMSSAVRSCSPWSALSFFPAASVR